MNRRITPHPAVESAAVLALQAQGQGVAMHDFCSGLYPMLRSITGQGVRDTLAVIGEHIPVTVTEVPTGTKIFDWEVPPEWQVRGAWIKGPDGQKVVDIADHNLHLVNYSAPFRGRLTLEELRPHLFSLPDRPDWIPYRTQYFKRDWGFCLTDRQLQALKPGTYEVCVDTDLVPGALTFGECVLPGESTEEVLVSTHVCHPSLANDNLSGIATATWLARIVGALSGRRYTYRFVFIPATIGAIAWLSQRQDVTRRVVHGVVISGVGDQGDYHYKQSRRGDADIDRIMALTLRESGLPHHLLPFVPYGYDERQYCSPGFNLPMGCFSRSTYGSYPQYHTSADNLGFIRPEYLERSLGLLLQALSVVERNITCNNLSPFGEPQLGRRGLYSLIGGHNEGQKLQLALLWVLNQSDGTHSLLEIAERAGQPFDLIHQAAEALLHNGLLETVVK
ncbi:MAG: DUF4910 domain-containing protein [Lautropia sp.]|nr:DUF4910 domain-containing protein [Lautropia sp.]